MTIVVTSNHTPCHPLELRQIEHRLATCRCLPSLNTIENALKSILGDEQRYTSQIAEIIRRDPSLTARILRLVNSVHFGIRKRVKTIEEAVFFLGMRQIHQLAMVTPIIEDFQIMAGHTRLEWRGFWRHCIGAALMTREVIDLVQSSDQGEVDYVAGLLHDVGKIAMASAFPDHFAEIYIHRTEAEMELMKLEREVLGMDHAELGALYLRKQSLPEVFTEIVQYHHDPDKAPTHSRLAAAVQVADLLVQEAKIGYSGRLPLLETDFWQKTTGWKILIGEKSEEEAALSAASLRHSLERVPATLESMV